MSICLEKQGDLKQKLRAMALIVSGDLHYFLILPYLTFSISPFLKFIYESRYIAYLATSGNKRETTK